MSIRGAKVTTTVIKPRLRRQGRVWLCTHCWATGYGDTPTQAYWAVMRKLSLMWDRNV